MISSRSLSCGNTGRISDPIRFPLEPQRGQCSSKVGTLQHLHQYIVELAISVLSPQCGHSDSSVVILQFLHMYFIILASHYCMKRISNSLLFGRFFLLENRNTYIEYIIMLKSKPQYAIVQAFISTWSKFYWEVECSRPEFRAAAFVFWGRVCYNVGNKRY